MISGFLVLGVLFLVSRATYSTATKEACLICREAECECEEEGVSELGCMSLKKLISHCLYKLQKKYEECDTVNEQYKFVARTLRNILVRSANHNINEEASIKDLILTKLRALRKEDRPEPHAAFIGEVLELILNKCFECEGPESPVERFLGGPEFDSKEGVYWYEVDESALRRERQLKECIKCKPPPKSDTSCMEKRRVQGRCFTKNANLKRQCRNFESEYKCPRYVNDDPHIYCNQFAVCGDCDKCKIVVPKTEEDIWLLCEGCKAMGSPFTEFHEGGSPAEEERNSEKSSMKIRMKYLQLNDFRKREEDTKQDRSNFLCPALSKLSRKKRLKERITR